MPHEPSALMVANELLKEPAQTCLKNHQRIAHCLKLLAAFNLKRGPSLCSTDCNNNGDRCTTGCYKSRSKITAITIFTKITVLTTIPIVTTTATIALLLSLSDRNRCRWSSVAQQLLEPAARNARSLGAYIILRIKITQKIN